jgi:hypothetical protein
MRIDTAVALIIGICMLILAVHEGLYAAAIVGALCFFAAGRSHNELSTEDALRAAIAEYLRAEENNPARPAWFRGALGRLAAEIERGDNAK